MAQGRLLTLPTCASLNRPSALSVARAQSCLDANSPVSACFGEANTVPPCAHGSTTAVERFLNQAPDFIALVGQDGVRRADRVDTAAAANTWFDRHQHKAASFRAAAVSTLPSSRWPARSDRLSEAEHWTVHS